MTTAVLIGDVVIFALGVWAGLSWPKIKSWGAKQEASVASDVKASVDKVADDVKAKL